MPETEPLSFDGWVCPVPLGIPPVGESTDFGKLACTIWHPILDAEARG